MIRKLLVVLAILSAAALPSTGTAQGRNTELLANWCNEGHLDCAALLAPGTGLGLIYQTAGLNPCDTTISDEISKRLIYEPRLFNDQTAALCERLHYGEIGPSLLNLARSTNPYTVLRGAACELRSTTIPLDPNIGVNNAKAYLGNYASAVNLNFDLLAQSVLTVCTASPSVDYCIANVAQATTTFQSLANDSRVGAGVTAMVQQNGAANVYVSMQLLCCGIPQPPVCP